MEHLPKCFLQTCAYRAGRCVLRPCRSYMALAPEHSLRKFNRLPDITYRIFDYNRKDKDGKSRELHTSQAMDAINFSDVQDDFRTEYERVQNEPVEMVASPYFHYFCMT